MDIMHSSKYRYQEINYYVDLDEISNLQYSKQQKLRLLNAQLTKNCSVGSTPNLNEVVRRKEQKKSSDRKRSKSRENAESRRKHQNRSRERKYTGGDDSDFVDDHPYGPPPRTSSRQQLPRDPVDSSSSGSHRSSSILQLDNNNSNASSSGRSRRKDNPEVSLSQINLRPDKVRISAKLSDPCDYNYRQKRWDDVKNVIYEYEDVRKSSTNSSKSVSRNKSFHSSRAQPSDLGDDNNVIRRNLNHDHRGKFQSADNLNNMKNSSVYINHLHREVVSNFINKNQITKINSNLFNTWSPNHSYNSDDRSLSKKDDIYGRRGSGGRKSESRSKKRHGSNTSDYHSDSSSSSSIYSSSGCYSGYSPPSSPSSPGSSAYFTPEVKPSPSTPFFVPKLLYVSSKGDRWVVRRSDGLIVEIMPEEIFYRERRMFFNKNWKKKIIGLFKKEGYVSFLFESLFFLSLITEFHICLE